MFVEDVVELVFPPFPPPPKLSARTAVPGTRSNGSVLAPAVVAVASASAIRPRAKPARPQIDRCMLFPPGRRSLAWNAREAAPVTHLGPLRGADNRDTVKAIVQDTYGPPDVLKLREIDKPVAADDEVLVRVHAAGVDQGVWHLM